MNADIVLTLLIVAAAMGLLVATSLAADIVLLAAMVALTATGVLGPERALGGFASPGVMTIAALYVVVAGLRETGAMAWFSQRVFGHPRSVQSAQIRLMAASGAISTVVSNTPVVAMFIPIAQEWARRLRFPVSRLLLPMNNIAILAGTCTLIGTSTNLVVDGLLRETRPEAALGLFEIARVGLPLTLAGFVFVVLFGRWLLPDREGAIEQLDNAREYSFEVRVPQGSPLVGRTIGAVGLRQMERAYLLEIARGDRLLTAVGPDEVIVAGDVLTFVGVADAVRDLQRLPGLAVEMDQPFRLNLRNSKRRLVELVLAPNSPLVGRTVRDGAFRTHYGAAIVSISREGRRLDGKLGDVCLRAGDTLLVETDDAFARRYRYNRDFLLVSALADSKPPDFARAPVAALILMSMIVLAATGTTSLFTAAFLAAGAMVATRCVALSAARRSIEYPVVVAIAASYALGFALTDTGAAAWLAQLISALAGDNPLAALVLVYIATVLVTEIVTNSAAGVLM
ncbi:MAG TPA: SLC13 family permease, partial [Steroidobacteraceae bacterium]|nr:SLC13 family permease [Steroidobacteraceae bacterium]